MQILELRPGIASAVVNALDVPMALHVDGWGGFFGFKAIITDVSGGLEGNAYFGPTALDLTYIYTFGDRISTMTIGGIAFADSCFNRGGPTGLEWVMEFYMANRVAARSTPSWLQIGAGAGGSFAGFLTSLRFNLSRPESRMAEFVLQYQTIPRLRG